MTLRDRLSRLFRNQFVRFLAVGFMNTLFGYGVYAVLIAIGLHYVVAALCSTVLGALFNFKTTGILVFGSHRNRLILRFSFVYLVIYFCNIVGLRLITSAQVIPIVAGAILAPPLAVLSFLLNRSWVFRREGGNPIVLDAVDEILRTQNITPVLIDVGATGGAPPIWRGLSPYSTYVGFDPDLRERSESGLLVVGKCKYRREVTIDAAVVAQSSKNRRVRFYLARSPQCSSTLKADLNLAREYLNNDLFEVVADVEVKATTLNEVARELSLSSFDWIKIDAQGADLRILNSVDEALRSRILCVDLEPGLVDLTNGDEDSFVQIHDALTRSGFWLSDFSVGEMPRIRESTMQRLSSFERGLDRTVLGRVLKGSPLFCNVRYLRTLSWCRENEYSKREYLLLWVFAAVVNQLGFALDVADEYQRCFGNDTVLKFLWGSPIAKILRRRALSNAISFPWLPIPGKIRRFLEPRVKLR